MADVFTKQKRKPILGYDVKHGPCRVSIPILKGAVSEVSSAK